MKAIAMRALPALLVAVSGVAGAGGMQTLEQSASGLGVSYAGSAATADDASTLFYNPAGLTRLPGTQLSVGAVGLKANVEASVGGGNAGESTLAPNLYLSRQLTPDWYVGLGVSRPFGLSTEYDAGWAGNAQAIRSEIKTVNYNPSVAYRLSDRVALGFGLNYQKIDVELTSTGGSYTGDDSALGWNAGALFTLSPAMRVGIAYRSPISYKVTGSADADLKLPGTFTLSVWQQVSDRWEAMGDLSFAQWNRFDRSDARFLPAGADYQNSWRLAWGAAYKQSDALKLKFGFAWDRSPTRNGNLSLRAPEYDRFWLSAGLQWNASRLGKVDLGYAYKLSRDADAAVAGKYDTSGHVLGLQYSAGF